MKNPFKLAIYILLIFALSSCKDDTTVQPEDPNNNQNANSPVLLSPANGIFVRDFTPQLDWQDFENTATYHIQVSLDANFNGIIVIDSALSTSALNIPAGRLTTGVYYYWRVIANLNGGGTSNWSAIWRFSVILNPPPAPILTAPANGSGNVPFMPFFDWNEAPTADSYRLQVSNSASFTTILLDTSGIVPTELQCPPGPLITGTQYFWRVNASNSGGLSTSEWSVTFNFTTVSGPLPLTISGRVTFADTNFVPLPTLYVAGAYMTWPPIITGAVEYDTLTIQQSGNTYYADYTITNLENESYKVAVSLLSSLSLTNTIMGIYGCDTVHTEYSSCPDNPTLITIQNYNGVENINFLTWADSTKRIF